MTPPYRVNLINLSPDVSAVVPTADKVDLGQTPAEEVFRLAGKLLKLDVTANPKAEPGIIVQRGEKGWRIAAHAGRLRMYKSTSLFDEYWTVDTAQGLAQLPPFAVAANTTGTRSTKSRAAQPQRYQAVRSIMEVAGLFLLGVLLIVVGFWYGLPHRKLSDLPPDVIVVTADSERTSVFAAVAGSYVAGKVKPGESIVTITSDGRVSLSTIGKDGKPSTPFRLDEQAKAARKGSLAAIVTSFGVIAELPPDAVNVGNGHWRKLAAN